jgi:glycine dehydrogenase subunit 1
MKYTPHTPEEIKEMLRVAGAESIEDFYRVIPQQLRAKTFRVREGQSEFEVLQRMKQLADENSTSLIPFIGAGFYDHYIPAVVDSIASLPQFYTAYTPYQAEASQGWLQALYEYQTAICNLTEMEVSNASLYDGGTALYEACLMAVRINKKKKIIVDSGVNLIYRTMLYSYTKNLAMEFANVPITGAVTCREEIKNAIDKDTSAVILQNPNFFGCIDDHTDITEIAHKAGALVIESVYPLSLGLLKTPGEMGVDIAVGEGQSLGIPLSFGGPYLGFMAAKKEFARKMPGRIIGKTVDRNRQRCFTMTLQAREQHIRREKATSNICSNESLCALRALVYLSLLGKEGIYQTANFNRDKAEYTKSLLRKIPQVEITKTPTYNEFVVNLPINANEAVNRMLDKGFIAGFPLGRYYKKMSNSLLVAVTEKRTKEEIGKYAESLEAVLCD